jgi:hypothetical protein
MRCMMNVNDHTPQRSRNRTLAQIWNTEAHRQSMTMHNHLLGSVLFS